MTCIGTVFSCNLAVLAVVIFLSFMQKQLYYTSFWTSILILILFLAAVRIALPFEFPFTETFFFRNDVIASVIPYLCQEQPYLPFRLSLLKAFLICLL